MQSGILFLKPLQAELTHTTEGIIGKMDPYIVFTLGNQKVKTSVCKNGGGKPFWSDVITLNKTSGDELLFIELWDASIMKDKYIANCQVSLVNLSQLGHVSQWIDVFFEGKPAGKLLLDISCQMTGQQGQTGIGQAGSMQTGIQQQQGEQWVGGKLRQDVQKAEQDIGLGNVGQAGYGTGFSNIPQQQQGVGGKLRQDVQRAEQDVGLGNVGQTGFGSGFSNIPQQQQGANLGQQGGILGQQQPQYQPGYQSSGLNPVPPETTTTTQFMQRDVPYTTIDPTTGLQQQQGTTGRNVGTGAVIPPTTFNK